MKNFCYAYSFATSLDFNVLKLLFGEAQISYYGQTMCVVPNQSNNSEAIFFFPYGAAIFWGLEKHVADKIFYDSMSAGNEKLGDIYEDKHEYLYGDRFCIEQDIISLPDTSLITKMSISHAIAQSVKLDGFNKKIDQTVVDTKHIPEELVARGKISMHRKKIRKIMGRILVDKNSINLHLNFLTTPKFFWDHPELEYLYDKVADNLALSERLDAINNRIEVLAGLFDVLNAELHQQHSSMLEWIIIVLIAVEVAISLFQEIF